MRLLGRLLRGGPPFAVMHSLCISTLDRKASATVFSFALTATTPKCWIVERVLVVPCFLFSYSHHLHGLHGLHALWLDTLALRLTALASSRMNHEQPSIQRRAPKNTKMQASLASSLPPTPSPSMSLPTAFAAQLQLTSMLHCPLLRRIPSLPSNSRQTRLSRQTGHHQGANLRASRSLNTRPSFLPCPPARPKLPREVEHSALQP